MGTYRDAMDEVMLLLRQAAPPRGLTHTSAWSGVTRCCVPAVAQGNSSSEPNCGRLAASLEQGTRWDS